MNEDWRLGQYIVINDSGTLDEFLVRQQSCVGTMSRFLQSFLPVGWSNLIDVEEKVRFLISRVLSILIRYTQELSH